MNFLTTLETGGFASWIRESPSVWAYPFIIFLHAAGLSLVVGLSAVIDLAVLGFAPGVELAPMEKLYRIIGAGFWINLASGLLLALIDATTMLVNPLFWIKMALVGLAVADVLVIKKLIFQNPLPDRRPLPPQVRALAVASLVLWMGAITAGRLTAYLGPVNIGPSIATR